MLREAMKSEQPLIDPIGVQAPMDLNGCTPLGYAAFKLNRKPSKQQVESLYSPGDRSVLPRTPLRLREGSSNSHMKARKTKTTAIKNDITLLPNNDGLIDYGFSEANGWRPSMEASRGYNMNLIYYIYINNYCYIF